MANMKVVSGMALVTGKSRDGGEVETTEHAPGAVVSLPAAEAKALIARGIARPAPAASKAGEDDDGEVGGDPTGGAAG